MCRRLHVSLVLWLALTLPGWSQASLTTPRTVLGEVPFGITVTAEGAQEATLSVSSGTVTPSSLVLEDGKFDGRVTLSATGPVTLTVTAGAATAEAQVRSIPGFLSLLPPLVAIGFALWLRQVLLALGGGILLGAALIEGDLLAGYQTALHRFLVEALADKDHASILLFTLSLGGLVALLSRTGGMVGMANWIARFARGPRSSQVATWAMGVAIFFDDYANTLLVGNTMRPLTDRHLVSREKLSYVVDSTAAPVSSIAVISTWIGYEMSLISDAFRSLGITANVYWTFLESIVYRYYATFTLVFVLAIAWMGRDFGPMLAAERRAWREKKLLGDDARPLADPDEEMVQGDATSPWNAILPITVVLVLTLAGLLQTGLASTGGWPALPFIEALGEVFGQSNSYQALLWASMAGGLVAGAMALGQKLLSLHDCVDTYMRGVKNMGGACSVLLLAWAIGAVCKDLHTAGYLVETSRGLLAPQLLPLAIFLISAAVAFATGSSWSTMAIVMPLAVGLAHELPVQAGLGPEVAWSLMVGTIASVLAGSTFGDHCSPISDTTIMSSMASAADHVDHVNTQIPYAVTTAAVACLIGSLPGGWGINPWLLNGLGIIFLVGIIRFIGSPVRENVGETPGGRG